MTRPRYEAPLVKSERFPLELALEQDRVAAGDDLEWQALAFREEATQAVLDLGGVAIRLRGDEAVVAEALRSSWTRFLVDAPSEPALDLSIRGVERPPFETPVALAATSERDGALLVKLRGVCARFQPDAGAASALVTRRSIEQELTNLLRFALMAAAPRRRRYLVRSAAVETIAGLALLIGPAQAGKSTAARLAAPRPVLSDDAVLVTTDGDGAEAHAVGLWGSEGSDGLARRRRPRTVSVAAVVNLRKGVENRVERLRRGRASLEIGCVTALLSKEPAIRGEALAFADELADRVACLELTFSNRDGSFWPLLEEAIAAGPR